MDDFLHNLRSGKLKQPDRQNRSYGDQQYKGGPRRNMADRRKRDSDNKESPDRMNAIKDVLESLAETQKRMATAYQERTRIEERKVSALEALAENLYRMLNPTDKRGDTVFSAQQAPEAQPEDAGQEIHAESQSAGSAPETVVEVNSTPMAKSEEALSLDAPEKPGMDIESAATDTDTDSDKQTAGRLTEVDRHTLFAVINQMRSEGNNWENISRHIANQGYPTVSGKGAWRGVMVKNLYEKMAAA